MIFSNQRHHVRLWFDRLSRVGETGICRFLQGFGCKCRSDELSPKNGYTANQQKRRDEARDRDEKSGKPRPPPYTPHSEKLVITDTVTRGGAHPRGTRLAQ